jgi:cytochrome d ubiquinol oxidase subunit I
VLITLILFVIVYAVIFSAGIVYINRLIRLGPSLAHPPEGVANRPLTAATDAAPVPAGKGA